ncbi:MAG: restriction endonuclease subunit S [Deltaproteobacteria bacterium]|nr:restriction endonuclease subunit S [Deltaproteobacteria bacterium]
MNMQPVPLSFLAEVRSGGGAPQDPNAFTTTGHPFIRAGSLGKLLDGASEQSLEKLEPTVAEKHGLKLFPGGTILFAKSGMSATKGYIYRLRQPAYVVNHLAALVPHDPADSAFLVRALQRFSPTALIKDPGYPSIRLGDIEDMEVLAPHDRAERWRIAEVLDGAETLQAKRRAALAQLHILTQAFFLDLFGDPATNPKEIRKVPLGELIKLKSGEFLPATEMVQSGAFPVLGGNGINGYHDKFMFETPQIIIGRVGVYCGCVHVSPPMSWVTDNAIRASLKNLYGFASDYPGIRHGGTPANAIRVIEMRDMIAMSILLAGFTPYLTDQFNAEVVYRGS